APPASGDFGPSFTPKSAKLEFIFRISGWNARAPVARPRGCRRFARPAVVRPGPGWRIPYAGAIWARYSRVALCRLSLFVANSIFGNFRHNRVASLSRGITRDAVGCRKLLFHRFLQAGHGISTSPEVSFHGFLDLQKLLRPASARSRTCFRLQDAAGLIRITRPPLRRMRISWIIICLAHIGPPGWRGQLMPAGEIEYCIFQHQHPVVNERASLWRVVGRDKRSHAMPFKEAGSILLGNKAQPQTPVTHHWSSFVEPTVDNILHEVVSQMALDLSGLPIGTR